MKLTNRKGNETTIRKVKTDDNVFVALIGTVKDLLSADLLLGEYPAHVMDKWLLMSATDEYDVKEFSSKEEIKRHLGIA